jgi:hypothetical protein
MTSSFVFACNFSTRRFMIAHRFSQKLRSGEQGGELRSAGGFGSALCARHRAAPLGPAHGSVEAISMASFVWIIDGEAVIVTSIESDRCKFVDLDRRCSRLNGK